MRKYTTTLREIVHMMPRNATSGRTHSKNAHLLRSLGGKLEPTPKRQSPSHVIGNLLSIGHIHTVYHQTPSLKIASISRIRERFNAVTLLLIPSSPQYLPWSGPPRLAFILPRWAWGLLGSIPYPTFSNPAPTANIEPRLRNV
jgi:hypothetical protein